MQTTHLICYADDQMTISQQLCIKSAKDKGKIDHAYSFSPASLDRFFVQRHKAILDSPQRGGGKGFWLWKPYIVEQVIRNLPDGDILIYCDSGIEWIAPVDHLLRAQAVESYEAENDIFLFSNGHRHIDWCKNEVMASMLQRIPGWDHCGQGYILHKQVQASVMLFRVNAYTREFCARWLAWSCIPGFIDDVLRGPQLPEFREHRNDQSILTNLAIDDGIPLHWWPAQYGHHIKNNHPIDRYPQMFYHHRWRNDEWKKFALVCYTHETSVLIDRFMKQPKNI